MSALNDECAAIDVNQGDLPLIKIAEKAYVITTTHFKELANTAFEKAKRHAVKPYLSLSEQRYLEVTRRLSLKELNALNQKLNELSNKEENINALIKAIQAGNYKDAIFSSPDLSYYALEALHLGYIDEYQFGTIQTLWAIKEQHGSFDTMRVIPFFNEDGTPNKEAYEIIWETCTNIAPDDEKVSFLKEEKLAELFEAFKKLPKSEQVFFTVPNQDLGPNHICNGLNEAKFNIFCRAPKRGVRMHPSLGMRQALINVKFKDQAVKINPVLGVSSAADFKKIDQRDLAVHFPGVELPKTADGYNAPYNDYPTHDLYHVVSLAAIPIPYRKWVVRLADFALEVRKELNCEKSSATWQTLGCIHTSLILRGSSDPL